MIWQDVFADSMIATYYQNFYDESTEMIEMSQGNIPIPLPLAVPPAIIERVSAEMQNLIPINLFGLKLTLRYPISMAFSGWIAHAVFRKYKTIYGSIGSSQTRVGIRQENKYVSLKQFSLLQTQSPVHILCAAGEYAEACLNVVVEAANTFDPMQFDSDGYSTSQ